MWLNNDILNDNKEKYIFDKNGNIKIKCVDIKFNNKLVIRGYVEEYRNINGNNILIYKGELENNTKNGFGTIFGIMNNQKETFKLYEGLLENNLIHGKGILYNSDNSVFYSGIFDKGTIAENEVVLSKKNEYDFEGEIITYNDDNIIPRISFIKGTYTCHIHNIKITCDIFHNGIHNGKKKLSLSNCCNVKIEFTYLDSKISFNGKKTGNILNGEFKKIFYNNLEKSILFKGTLEINRSNSFISELQVQLYYTRLKKGRIISIKTNKILSEGNYYNELLHGIGKKYIDGILKDEGCFRGNKLNNQGKTYYKNGIVEYDGIFYNGYRHGLGTLYDKDGTIIYNGNFRYNEIQ